MKKVEVLAPAGNMQCFKAAMNAGADAVYMAGKSFGARAGAENFTTEEYVTCLDLAHILGKKIYLTLNTLIKEREWSELQAFLQPLYESGLDGVIFQDLGLIGYLKSEFPGLPLHASTQMTITDSHSALALKELGVERIVPARELSLKEMKKLKDDTGLEIECFVHGAMCYCYSGQCFFSSFLGGRSGNRGRCAGTCRLPFKPVQNGRVLNECREQYPLSLKDMNCIDIVPELIDAGIDSFKIEGRLKSPEYVAGTVSIYKKAVDSYLETGKSSIDKRDREILSTLYLRSGVIDGYYHRHNGNEMVTLDSPSYNNRSDATADHVKDKIMSREAKLPITIEGYFKYGEPVKVTAGSGEIKAVVEGDLPDKALNRATTREEVIKQLGKTGDTYFKASRIDVELDDDLFLPVKKLNEYRRMALEELEAGLLSSHRRMCPDYSSSDNPAGEEKPKKEIQPSDSSERYISERRIPESVISETFLITIQEREQAEAICSLADDIDKDKLTAFLYYDLIASGKGSDLPGRLKEKGIRTGIVLPRILRAGEEAYYKSLVEYLKNHECQVLVHNLEQMHLLSEEGIGRMIADYTLYGYNKSALAFLRERFDMVTAPVELSAYQIYDLEDRDLVIPIYGHIPMMVSANCINNTLAGCDKGKKGNSYVLRDRYKKEHYVKSFCLHCYNEIYNAIPNSYHKKFNELKARGFSNFKIDLTVEDAAETSEIIRYYLEETDMAFPLTEYTTGHIDKGVL
ncbi:MAG: U32 family peptidase [Lachnospiraceae bacterium]|nr:U32 family peptidase [Lachnospiraceae bacterium]